MSRPFLLYGSTGFNGDLIARQAVGRGLRPVLAGRNRAKVEAQAAELGLDCRVFDLSDSSPLEQAVADVGAVLHCAGPFAQTAPPMLAACLKTGRHYLDITGELPVFEALAARDGEARAAGTTLLPGMGVEIAATDCLAVHLKRRLPAATHLALAWAMTGPSSLSRGSLATMAEHSGYARRIRREGRLELQPGVGRSRRIDLGSGPVRAIPFPWPDAFTAFLSTGIPNIECYWAPQPRWDLFVRSARRLRPLLGPAVLRGLMRRFFETLWSGPDPETRSQSTTLVWGEVTDDQGRSAVSRLIGPEGYTWTALTAIGAVERVLAGQAPPGFQTPAKAFGPDFVLECGSVRREDLACVDRPALAEQG
jgi:short subunit dehydrogenase-like uncharacterized protein